MDKQEIPNPGAFVGPPVPGKPKKGFFDVHSSDSILRSCPLCKIGYSTGGVATHYITQCYQNHFDAALCSKDNNCKICNQFLTYAAHSKRNEIDKFVSYKNGIPTLRSRRQTRDLLATSSEAECNDPAVPPDVNEPKENPAITNSRKRKRSPPRLAFNADPPSASCAISKPAETHSIPHQYLVLVNQNATENRNESTTKGTDSNLQSQKFEGALIFNSALVQPDGMIPNNSHTVSKENAVQTKLLDKDQGGSANDAEHPDTSHEISYALLDHNYATRSHTNLPGLETISSQDKPLDFVHLNLSATAAGNGKDCSVNKEPSQQSSRKNSYIPDAELFVLHKVSRELIEGRKLTNDLKAVILEKDREIANLKQSLDKEKDKTSLFQKQVQTTKDTFEKEREEYQITVAQLEEENQRLTMENEEISQDIVEIVPKNEKLLEENDDLRGKLKEESKAKLLLKNENQQLQTEIDTLKPKVEKLTEKEAQQILELQTAKDVLEKIQQESLSLHRVLKLRNEIQERNDLRETTAEVEILRKEKYTLEMDIEGLKTEKERQLQEIDNLNKTVIPRLQQKKASIEQNIADKLSKFSDVMKQLKSLVVGNSDNSVGESREESGKPSASGGTEQKDKQAA